MDNEINITTPTQQVADALRKVAAKLTTAWDEGDISADVTVFSLNKTLLMIAEELDPE
jgi:hypothetical protein